ncbi:MAG TPA: cobalt-precorrin-5B (C(1))-methyltransferase [Rhodobacteraceae bacterium]|nr:cobalt-precorrin-5B (C(1))-methyltransferase [Paracoccaceae bacterium]
MDKAQKELRRGWTTGACAAAAAKAACQALLTGDFPDPVTITLPGGQQPAFALARTRLADNDAMAAIVKDAGDDPDVTHGALIEVRLMRADKGAGLTFRAGPGVGTATLAGLPIAPGEPAINPAPRAMIARAIADVSPNCADFVIEISVPGGEKIAQKTLNPRLGIIGGISILGTTGIVIPFSCAAWIHSIHRGIDVARGAGHEHIAAATGNTSEKAVQMRHGLDEQQLIDMGDFVGGTLKYLKSHPVRRLTIAGGIAKMTKLAQGLLDLHSKRGRADMVALAALIPENDRTATGLADNIRRSNTVAEAFDHAATASFPLGNLIARKAWQTAAPVLGDNDMELEILLFDRTGKCRGHMPFTPIQSASRSRPEDPASPPSSRSPPRPRKRR